MYPYKGPLSVDPCGCIAPKAQLKELKEEGKVGTPVVFPYPKEKIPDNYPLILILAVGALYSIFIQWIKSCPKPYASKVKSFS